ncbi:MAG: shikimate kinase [Lachnospiraceae bacterium]|nr:shikimate kinase [Clostridia bacterium]MBQ8964876.1 shikimate kinase [Clostridia bacterium]MBQ9633183.1 shikimate kinase [Lachnospiraceae bacterium]
MNIILIGMPASGKSTVGVILAKLLGYDFIDTDLLIQKQTGLRLSEIIRSQGLDAFLAAEEAACLSLRADHSVIATGGSVIYSDAAMRHLKELGTVVFLSVDFKALQSRLHDVRGRGVVLRSGQSLVDLYAERVPLYREYADITVPEGQGSLEETVQAVYRKVQEDE